MTDLLCEFLSAIPDSAYRNQSNYLDSSSWISWSPTDVIYFYENESANYANPFKQTDPNDSPDTSIPCANIK